MEIVGEADWVMGEGWVGEDANLQEMEAKLKVLYEQGMTYVKMAEALGTSFQWVKNHLATMRAYGIVEQRPMVVTHKPHIPVEQLITSRMAPIYGVANPRKKVR